MWTESGVAEPCLMSFPTHAMQSSTAQHGQVLQVCPTFVPQYSRVPVDLLGNGFRHFALPTWQYVTVNVHRGAGLGVTNSF